MKWLSLSWSPSSSSMIDSMNLFFCSLVRATWSTSSTCIQFIMVYIPSALPSIHPSVRSVIFLRVPTSHVSSPRWRWKGREYLGVCSLVWMLGSHHTRCWDSLAWMPSYLRGLCTRYHQIRGKFPRHWARGEWKGSDFDERGSEKD